MLRKVSIIFQTKKVMVKASESLGSSLNNFNEASLFSPKLAPFRFFYYELSHNVKAANVLLKQCEGKSDSPPMVT